MASHGALAINGNNLRRKSMKNQSLPFPRPIRAVLTPPSAPISVTATFTPW